MQSRVKKNQQKATERDDDDHGQDVDWNYEEGGELDDEICSTEEGTSYFSNCNAVRYYNICGHLSVGNIFTVRSRVPEIRDW